MLEEAAQQRGSHPRVNVCIAGVAMAAAASCPQVQSQIVSGCQCLHRCLYKGTGAWNFRGQLKIPVLKQAASSSQPYSAPLLGPCWILLPGSHPQAGLFCSPGHPREARLGQVPVHCPACLSYQAFGLQSLPACWEMMRLQAVAYKTRPWDWGCSKTRWLWERHRRRLMNLHNETEHRCKYCRGAASVTS